MRENWKVEWINEDNEEVVGVIIDRKEEKILVIIVYMNKDNDGNRKMIERWMEENKE